MGFKVGDRIITNGGLVKGIIISITYSESLNLNSVKFDHSVYDMILKLWDYEISLDVQYYREEKLNKLLG